jgi:hypothetical protein
MALVKGHEGTGFYEAAAADEVIVGAATIQACIDCEQVPKD